MFRRLDDRISVAGQISPDDVATAAAQGFTTIVNNRPDDETFGQPAGAEIEAAARDAGLVYRAIPVDHSGFDEAQVAAMREVLAGATGPVLAFCRSGTRSTYLWALAQAQSGTPPAELIEKAAGSGYDLSPLAATLAGLASR